MSEQYRVVILNSNEAVLAVDRGDQGIFRYSVASAVLELLGGHVVKEYGDFVRKEDLSRVSQYINQRVKVRVVDGKAQQTKSGTVVGIRYSGEELRLKVKFRPDELDFVDFSMDQITLEKSTTV